MRHDEAAKPGVTNLLELLGACTGTLPAEAAALGAGRDRAAAFAAPRLDSAMRAIGLMS